MTKNANLLCPTRACALTQQEYTAPTQMPSSCTDAANCKDGTRTRTNHAHCRVIESKLNRTQHEPPAVFHAPQSHASLREPHRAMPPQSHRAPQSPREPCLPQGSPQSHASLRPSTSPAPARGKPWRALKR